MNQNCLKNCKRLMDCMMPASQHLDDRCLNNRFVLAYDDIPPLYAKAGAD